MRTFYRASRILILMLDSGLDLDLASGEDGVKVADSRPLDIDCRLMRRVLMVSLILEARARASRESCLM